MFLLDWKEPEWMPSITTLYVLMWRTLWASILFLITVGIPIGIIALLLSLPLPSRH